MSDVLAGAASTFSKHPRFWSGDPDWQPQTVQYGRGARLVGNDGISRLDWVSSLGALSLGHPDVLAGDTPANHWADAISRQIWDGAGYSLPHGLEREVAVRLTNLLCLHVPGWHDELLGLRWGKTGSDACAMAIRLARAITGRQRCLSVGYHGWSAEFISATPPAWGVIRPQAVRAVPFGDLQSLTDAFREGGITEPYAESPVAAVIIEQPPQPIPDGYWSAVRALCDEYGALLILDEVVTGLRYGFGGAAQRFGIAPDLLCMGKAIGNTLPISCIVGRRSYFDWFGRNDPVFVSSTHFGEAVSLAGCAAVLDCWDQSAVDHVWSIGRALMSGLGEIGIPTVGYPPVFLTQWPTEEEQAYFVWRMAQLGVLMNRPNIPNLAHTLSDIEATVHAAATIKAEMQTVDIKEVMKNRLPITLFRNR